MAWVYNATPAIEELSQYRLILAVCLSLTILMVSVVCLRLIVRVRASRLGAADYVMVVGMIFSIFYSGLCIAQSRYGLGLPLKMRPKANLETYTKLNYAGRPFYQLGIAGFKASLCLSYLRLLSGTSKSFYRIITWAVIVFSTLGHTMGALVLILDCQPVEKAWNTLIPGRCLPVAASFYGLAIFTIVFDVIIILLPIPLLLQLNIKPAQKAGVVCLFLLGLFTTVCSILRLSQIWRVAFGDGNSTMLVLWGTIEFNIGNITTCVPYLAPLFKGYVRDFRSTSRKYDSRGRSYGIENWSRENKSHSQSHASGPSHLRRTPSEELILSSRTCGGIEMTVEYSILLEHEYSKI
ncbi:hypothetical protein N7495_001888 [Penicillium taxi]|uniref:uncharacterized protein n=1 Tax=Penicillium taxi TaxID=168475 RepID=UPI0025455618|nr:uncharacterized protein N7495_001888 [Penicillium taxi]KAJ5909206.1 hypothetical protein N7495_001888 [Penicillium taxi]